MARAAFKVMAVVALLVLAIPAGALRAEVPQPGTDVMRAAGSVEITVDGIGTGYVRLIGDVSIVRKPPNPNTPDMVPIEIVSLSLTGFSPVFGRVVVAPSVASPSTGSTLRMAGVESPSDSFFDVFFDIFLPDLGMTLKSGGPFRIQARTTAVPFFDVFTGMFSQMVPLVNAATGMPMGSLTHVALDPNPRVDIMFTDARLDWTVPPGGRPDTVPLSGRSIVVASDSWKGPGPIGIPEFNTEIIAMDLTGFSPMWGDTVFMEQVMLHSPGRSVAQQPGPPSFPADSFFDVFFDIRTSFFDVFCPDPLTGKAMIDAWPPFGMPYASTGPCALFSPGGAQPMGTLDAFSWIWTQPAGACVDADGDGVDAPPCGTDCDDTDPNNYPGNLEACADGRDNNCNQAIDCQDPLCLGRPCDDGDPCTQDDRCVQGPGGASTCQGAPLDCDDRNPCTADSCDPAAGACRHVPLNCDDGNACTSDSCDPLTGQCVHTTLGCDDGDACTRNDHCVQGPLGGTACQGDPVDCDDSDPCTSDTCAAATGCSHAPRNCDDFDACTSDSCQAQACVVPDNGGGTADLPAQCPYNAQDRLAIPQADGTILFVDDFRLRSFTCPPATPVVCSFPSPVPGSDCSQPGGTLAGEEACADAVLTIRFSHWNPITGQAYNRTFDLPVSLEMHAAPRTPGDPVQSFDTDMFRLFGQITMDPDFDLLRVTAGTDFGMPSPGHTTLTQAGGNWGVDSFFDIALRIDSVLAQGSQLPLIGVMPWTVRFRTGGGCVHTPVVCDDGNPCTTDSCDPATGACKFVPAPGAPCSDGDRCTQDDRCVSNPFGGTTCQGAPVDCNDNDPCTADSCDPLTGQCLHVPVNCDDGDLCTVDSCNPVTGACEHLPVVCDDGNQCTADSCDPATGQCRFSPLLGATCDDGDACTEGDRCVFNPLGNIICQGAPVNCDDGDACTQDGCNQSGCIVPDNGTGTATLPPQGCGYATEVGNDLMIIDGLAAGDTIHIPALHRNFSCPASSGVCSFALPSPGVDCDQAGGTLGGEEQCADSILELRMMGTGTLLGFNRIINLPVSFETHSAPRTPGDPVQSFDTDVFRLFGQVPPGDPDFDLLRITAGTDFSLPSPGHTVLTRQGGNWAVDSFFDITLRIDFVGAPGGAVAGRSGSTTGTVRFRTAPGGCVHVPVSCDDQNPCTTDRCNPVTGACEHLPVVCDDGNQCTKDSCDPATGQCRFEPLLGAACDDGNTCTESDRCVFDAAGNISCQGAPVNCDDNDPCTLDRCDPQASACVVPDNGGGTATLPPQGCGYVSQSDLMIIDGLPAGTTIDMAAIHRNFSCPSMPGGVCSFPPPIPGVDCDQPGGTLGGEQECADSILGLNMRGTGTLAGFNRTISLAVSFESHAAPRTVGDPVQSFDTDMFRLFGQLPPGDPDFDLLRITAGTDFGMPSPGHTTLTQQGGNWAVDSFFDITLRIDFVGAPGGTLAGRSGSTTGTVRFSTGGGPCVHLPVSCDDGNPCTVDRCNPVTGECEHLPVVCDDQNRCTQDSCDPATGQCLFVPLPDGTLCDDGDACTRPDVCRDGQCAGPPVNCDDGDLCTFDRCDPLTGLCVHAPVDCDDGNACTADSCDPASGRCINRPIPVLEPDPINFRDNVTIFWTPTPDATHWNTHRGTIPATLLGSRLPASVYDQACYESDDVHGNGATIAMDQANPPKGTAFYYLTSGEGLCGESPIGHASGGATIPNTSPCPTPP